MDLIWREGLHRGECTKEVVNAGLPRTSVLREGKGGHRYARDAVTPVSMVMAHIQAGWLSRGGQERVHLGNGDVGPQAA